MAEEFRTKEGANVEVERYEDGKDGKIDLTISHEMKYADIRLTTEEAEKLGILLIRATVKRPIY